MAQAASMLRCKFEQELPLILSRLDATGSFRVKLNVHLFSQTDGTPAAAHASMAAALESLLGDSAALIDATSRRIRSMHGTTKYGTPPTRSTPSPVSGEIA